MELMRYVSIDIIKKRIGESNYHCCKRAFTEKEGKWDVLESKLSSLKKNMRTND